MKVLLTGGSGLIGTALKESLTGNGHQVVSLVRRTPNSPNERQWDPAAGILEVSDVDGFDAVVHLAGAGIGDKRWSVDRKLLLLDSRVDSTELLTQRLAEAKDKPEVLISGSAIGFYGYRPEPVDESDGPPPEADFLSDLCVAWEGATRAAEQAGIRTVHIRTGIVLAKSGGALQKLLLPFRLGVGGQLGSGKTWWSWISLPDQVRAIEHLIDTPVTGPVNLVAPLPVPNSELTRALGNTLKRPTLLPVPRFVLNTILGAELAQALLFTSVRVLPTKLEETGFTFRHRTIKEALAAVLDRS